MTIPYQHNCFHIPEGWCLKCVSELQQQLEDAQIQKREAELAELRRDKERLDWLEKQGATVSITRWIDDRSPPRCFDAGKTRERIDEAMKEAK